MKIIFANPGRWGTHTDAVPGMGKRKQTGTGDWKTASTRTLESVRYRSENAPALDCAKGRARRQTNQGIMLVECMVYVVLFFIILGVAFKIFYSCWDNAKAIRRNTDQIAATLKLGERWRQDVRSATAAPRATDSGNGIVLNIPQKHGGVEYRFGEASLWRRQNAGAEWTEVLAGVKSSRMEEDRRQAVTAWRWELELASKRKGTHVLPLFTFEAVPSAH